MSAAIAIAVGLSLAIFFWLAGELRFLTPWRSVLLSRYSTPITLYALALCLNLFAATLAVIRRLGLRRAGRRLEHLVTKEGLGSTIGPPPEGRQER